MRPARDGRRNRDDREGRVFRRSVPRTGPAALVALFGFLGLPLLAGAAATVCAGFGVPGPALAPWGAALLCAGIAAWRVWRLTGGGPALRLWGWQLLPHAAWPPALAIGGAPLAALAAVAAAVLAALVARAFAPLDRAAAVLMLPVMGWAAFAMLTTGS